MVILIDCGIEFCGWVLWLAFVFLSFGFTHIYFFLILVILINFGYMDYFLNFVFFF